MHPDLQGCLLCPHELTIAANISHDGGRRKVAMSRKLKNMPGYEYSYRETCVTVVI